MEGILSCDENKAMPHEYEDGGLDKEFDFSKAVKNPYIKILREDNTREEYDIKSLNPRKNPFMQE